jgi:signal transduction histidine kinase
MRTGSLRPHAGMLRFLAFQLLIWSVYGVVHYAASIPAIDPHDRVAIGLAKGVRALTGLGISSLLVPLLEWRKNWRGLIPLAAAAAVSAGFAWMITDRILFVTAASIAHVRIPWKDFIHGVDLDYLFVMIAWTTGYVTSMLLNRSRSEREELLKQRVRMQDAQMSLLAAQLNPHFLFNSLNTIRSLAAEDVGKTREVVSRLSSFLRRVISFDTATPVRLNEEVGLARDYLAVEQARFEEDLQVQFDVDPASADVLVPPLILQPLIENAIKHGEAGADGIRHIAIGTSATDGRLTLRVENSGRLNGAERSNGVGVQLTRDRLAHLYGDGGSFALTSAEGKVVAAITIDLDKLRGRDS